MASSPTPSERERSDKEAKARETVEQAALPYKWTQTIGEVDVTVPVPANIRGRDLVVSLTKTGLRVGLKGADPILDGSFPHPIQLDDSTWTLESVADGKEVVVHLEKINKMEWWAHVDTSAPKIDTSKITPENSKLGDLDGETR